MSSALANPDFAIICAFFDRFSDLCGIEKQDTKQLIEWLQNTDDVHPELAELHMKLLRKLRKTVHAAKWEKALIKFCYMSTTMQDAWEIERFGYKKASMAVKLRVLKSLLEYQFDANVKFKTAINLATSNDLRGTPIGKDELGNAYWYFIDEKCNIFIYQENSDDETWRLVASNREEFIQLIQRLKDRVPIAPPSNDDVIDEEDSSNSQPAIPLTTTPSVEQELKAEKEEPLDTTNKVASLKITLTNPNKDGVSEIVNKNEDQEESETKPKVTSHQSSDSPLKITITTKGRKGTPKKLINVVEHPSEVKSPETVKEEEHEVSRQELPTPETPVKRGRGRGRKPKSPEKTPAKAEQTSKKLETPPKNPPKRGGGARGGKRARRSGRNTRNHKASDSDEVGSEIEEPVLHVKGEGSGALNQSVVPFECSEVIEESVMYFHGEGSGCESLVGNPEQTDSNKEQAKPTPVVKQSFFFGSPGCLKNRPMTAFGTSSLFSFGGQTTFGASSSFSSPTTLKKGEELKKDNDEVDHDKVSHETINLKPCNRFTSPKSLESLPVSKLGNTQNFEDIIDDDWEPSDDPKPNDTEDSGCPKSENNVSSLNDTKKDLTNDNLVSTPDEAKSISEKSETSYTPPLSPKHVLNQTSNNNQHANKTATISNESLPLESSSENRPELLTDEEETETTNDLSTELHCELSISDIPLPDDSPPSTSESEIMNTKEIDDKVSEIPLPQEMKEVPKQNDEVTHVNKDDLSPEESKDTYSDDVLKNIPLPDDNKSKTKNEQASKDSASEQNLLNVNQETRNTFSEIPLPEEVECIKSMERVEQSSQVVTVESKITEKEPIMEQRSEDVEKEIQVTVNDIPLPDSDTLSDVVAVPNLLDEPKAASTSESISQDITKNSDEVSEIPLPDEAQVEDNNETIFEIPHEIRTEIVKSPLSEHVDLEIPKENSLSEIPLPPVPSVADKSESSVTMKIELDTIEHEQSSSNVGPPKIDDINKNEDLQKSTEIVCNVVTILNDEPENTSTEIETTTETEPSVKSVIPLVPYDSEDSTSNSSDGFSIRPNDETLCSKVESLQEDEKLREFKSEIGNSEIVSDDLLTEKQPPLPPNVDLVESDQRTEEENLVPQLEPIQQVIPEKTTDVKDTSLLQDFENTQEKISTNKVESKESVLSDNVDVDKEEKVEPQKEQSETNDQLSKFHNEPATSASKIETESVSNENTNSSSVFEIIDTDQTEVSKASGQLETEVESIGFTDEKVRLMSLDKSEEQSASLKSLIEPVETKMEYAPTEENVYVSIIKETIKEKSEELTTELLDFPKSSNIISEPSSSSKLPIEPSDTATSNVIVEKVNEDGINRADERVEEKSEELSEVQLIDTDAKSANISLEISTEPLEILTKDVNVEKENEICLTVAKNIEEKYDEPSDSVILETSGTLEPEIFNKTEDDKVESSMEVSTEALLKSDTSSSQGLQIVESDEKSNISQDTTKIESSLPDEQKDESTGKPSSSVSEPQVIEYQQKKKRARTESGSLKERILFRPQIEFIQNDIQPCTSNIEVQLPEPEQGKIDHHLKLDVQPDKSSAEHSNVSSLEEQDASRGSRESGTASAPQQQHRQFIPFEESQNANDALYASSTESSKADVIDESTNAQKYISKREKAMQRTTFNDFSVSKLIGSSNQEPNLESKIESIESATNEKGLEIPVISVQNIEAQSTLSPVKHSIESMMAKSPRSSPSPHSEQSVPLDLQKTPLMKENEPISSPQETIQTKLSPNENTESRKPRGRGRRKASNDVELSSPEPKETLKEQIVEPPPTKKPQISETTQIEEPVVKSRGRGRKKSTPVRHEPEPIEKNVSPEITEQALETESKRPRKSVSPEKVTLASVVESEIISPEKIAPKLRAKALAKKSVSQERLDMEVNRTKSVEKDQSSEVKNIIVSPPKLTNAEVLAPETAGRSTRNRNKRVANEPLVETQIAKELKTEVVKAADVPKSTPRSRKRRISEENLRRRQTSESDNDVVDQNVELEASVCPESSEDDYIAPAGGKRAKMRGKQVDTSLRKEIESKKQEEIPTTSASEEDPLPRTRGGRQTRRSGGATQPVVTSLPEKKRNVKSEAVVSPNKEQKVEEPKKEDGEAPKLETLEKHEQVTNETPKETKPGRRGKAKRRNEAVSAKVTNEVLTDASTKKGEESCNKEEVSVVDTKTTEEQTPISSPDSKKAKIDTTPEKLAEAEPVQPEPKKKGGRPRKSTVVTPLDAPVTPKKNINAVSSEIDPSNVIQTIDNDAPVRQSRRIAQAKIREEAERRKMEEIMLAQLKADNDKKKRQEAKDKDFVPRGFKLSSDSENDDSNASGSRKRGRKKRKDKKNWKTSDESSSEEPEEEHSDQHSEPDVRHAALKSDHEFSCESEDEDAQVVPTKRARTVKKEDQSDSDDDNPEHACQKCHKTDHPEWILLCDSCDKGYHCSCLKPVLFLIPEGDWFCPPCQHNKLIETLEQKLLDYDFLSRQLALAEIHRQREEKLAAEQEAVAQAEKERCEAERKIKEENDKNAKSSSASNSTDGSSDTDSDDDKPLYKLRRRNQVPVTYRFNDYDDMINRAIKRDMEEVEEANQGSGNAGRGKDISTIIEADKEEKRRQSMALEDGEPKPGDEKEPGETSESDSHNNDDKKSEGDADEPISRPSKKSSSTKKPRKKPRRKLNQLDLSSDEDDPTDESFKGSSDNSSDEEENFSASSAETESSLELAAYRKKANKDGRPYATRRRRQTRLDQKFINDNDSGEESDVKPTRKKKKKSDSEEFELSEDSDEGSAEGSEDSEDVDSEELCDDSDSDSDSEYRWSKRKKKRDSTGVSTQAAGKQPRKGFGKKRSGKRVEDEDKAFRAGISKKKILGEKKKDESEDSDDSDKPIRKTRGRQMHYLEDDFESSDEGIKPGVYRPDTPPEEREAFIRKQEEIKRMLAEKNAEAAKALATPTIPGGKADMKIEPPADNISIIPASVIETAKVLDADYHKIKPGQSVFDDLPDDFNPDEMDDEELAKMMEEEDFANHQMKLAGDLKNRKLKEGESPSKKPVIDPSVLPTNLVKLPKQVEKKLKKKKEEGGEDVEPPSIVQAPIANIPTEAEMKARNAPTAQIVSKPSHVPLHPNAPPNVTIASQGPLSGKPRSLMQQHHGPPPHLYQGPPGYPPGNLPPHIYAQMRPGIQPHPGMPGFGSHGPPPQHLSNMYAQNVRGSSLPSNLNPALRSLMNMPPSLPPVSHQRHSMNPLMAMSQIPTGSGPPSSMNRNVPPSAMHKDPGVRPPSVIASPSTVAPVQSPVQPQKEVPPPIVEANTPVKKRGRRKKITPLRDDLPKNDPSQSLMQMKPEFKAQAAPIPTDGPKLSVVGQPQLFSLTQSAPASVITRVIPQAPALANLSKSSPGSKLLPQSPQHYAKSPPHPTRGPNPPIIQGTGAGATQPSSAQTKSPHLPSEPGRLAAIHSQPSPYRHSPSGVIYHGGPPPGSGRVYHEPVPIHHRIHHTGPPPTGTPPSGSRSPSQRPGLYPGQYPPHHIAAHQFGPYPYPGGPANPENRSPAHSTSSAGSPYQPPGNRTPQNFANDEDRPRSGSAGAGSGGNNSNSGGAGEFSGLVSYFSSQHDDLNS